jgi:hypothetical protein
MASSRVQPHVRNAAAVQFCKYRHKPSRMLVINPHWVHRRRHFYLRRTFEAGLGPLAPYRCPCNRPSQVEMCLDAKASE